MKIMQAMEEKSLADIAAKNKFAIVDGPFGTQLHAAEYKVEGVPVIRVVNTSYAGQFISENLVFISEKKAEQLKRSKVVPGDIIVAKTGATIGKSGIFPNNFFHGIIASSCIKLTVDQTTTDYRFVGYLIQSWEGQKKIIDGAGGSTRTTINTKPFGAIHFLFPSKPEQTKIADILSTVDRAIEQTEALIAKQQRIKTGLMQDLLTRGIDEHGNLRSEKTHKFKDSPLGRIPVEWEVAYLGNVSEISSGLTLGKNHFGPNTVELPYLRVANVQDGYLDLTEIKVIRVPKSNVQRYQLQIGDVLMNEGGDFDKLGRGSVWNGEIDQCLHQNHVFKVRPQSGVLASDYLAAVSASPYGKAFFVLASKQSTNLASINSTQLKSFPIPLPEFNEQLRIERMIKQNISAHNEAIKRLRKLRSLKTALMQDLLTGKKSVTPLLTEPQEAGA